MTDLSSWGIFVVIIAQCQWFSQSDIRAIISAPYLFRVVTFVLFAVATPNKYGDLLFESRVTSRRLRESQDPSMVSWWHNLVNMFKSGNILYSHSMICFSLMPNYLLVSYIVCFPIHFTTPNSWACACMMLHMFTGEGRLLHFLRFSCKYTKICLCKNQNQTDLVASIGLIPNLYRHIMACVNAYLLSKCKSNHFTSL